jgi:hypothetical protein
MQTATFEGEVYEDGQQYRDDAKLMVRFEMRAVKHEFNSIKEGRPIFVDIPYIYVITPGSRDVMAAEATPDYQRRFKRQWDAFISREAAPESGTPLSEVTWLTKSQVAEMQAMNIKTVEHLVNLPDSLANGVMGYHQIKDRARRFLAAAAGEAPMLAMEAKLKERDLRLEEQAREIELMKAQIKTLMPQKVK